MYSEIKFIEDTVPLESLKSVPLRRKKRKKKQNATQDSFAMVMASGLIFGLLLLPVIILVTL
jgi:hypothetical protein